MAGDARGLSGSAQARSEVRRLIESPDFISSPDEAERRLAGLPAKAVVRALLASLCSAEEARRHRAAALLGTVVAALAQRDMEAGREVMRRLVWSLNEESGTIGWGAPEAMAEIMARHQGLAGEFACLLASLATPGLNPLDNPSLLGSVVWGLGMLARTQPEVAACLDMDAALLPWLGSGDPRLRGLAAWATGQAVLTGAGGELRNLAKDGARLTIFANGRLDETTVAQLARQALDLLPETT